MTHRTIDDLDHGELATLVGEYLLGGHLIDRAGMPVVTEHGIETMRDVAIDEWMGASPIYTKRTQRLLGFEAGTVEACFKAMQLEIGAPLEFMDFRFTVDDDHHGRFHLDHCGALMDVEPMGEEFVVAMCHDIEDPTFDATAWATHPQMIIRPIHRPPRTPADRHPHCAWTVTIDESRPPTPEPPQLARIAASKAAHLPLTEVGALEGAPDGRTDYAAPLDPDLRIRDFSSPVLRAFAEEVCLQGHYLSISFMAAVEDRLGTEAAVDAGARQLTGVAGAVSERLVRAFGLGDDADAVATVFSLHPAFRPAAYVDWRVATDGDAVELELGPCPARDEQGLDTWISLLADGHDRPLGAIARGVDPRWTVRPDGPNRWVAERGDEPQPELDEVTLTKFSTGVAFELTR
ncbi:MAG: hypothetical protein KDA97_03045 [Acidimicrobiales bacterium]|nr:hypothetical protein [Acidimicrobiales bacterium]